MGRKFLILAACCCVCMLQSAAQVACSPDASFNGNGLLVSDGSRLGEQIVTLPDGKMLVACNPFGNGHAYIRRFNEDGSPDAGYGTAGKCNVQIMEKATRINGMVVYSGNTYIAGTTSTDIGGTDTYPFVAAITASGAFLSSFGTAGKTTFPSLYTCAGLRINATGNIFIAGLKSLDELYVMKLNNTGAPLATFDGDGVATAETGDAGIWYEVADLQLAEDGSVIVAGKQQSSSSTSPAFWKSMAMKVTPSGAPDVAFGVGGIALHNSSIGALDETMKLHLRPDGTMLLCGNTYKADAGNDYDYSVLRLLANGSADASFGTGGWVVHDLLGTQDQEYSLNSALLPDGRILMTGNQGDGDTVHFSLLMLDSDGSRDVTFAPLGVYTNIFNHNNNSSSSGLGITTEGKIILAGYTRTCSGGVCGPLYMALARYNSSFAPASIAPQKGTPKYNIWPTETAAGRLMNISDNYSGVVVLYNNAGMEAGKIMAHSGLFTMPFLAPGWYTTGILSKNTMLFKTRILVR